MNRSNPVACKPTSPELLVEEFFLQGDREKGLKLDPGFLMDRDKRLGSAFSLGCLVAG